MKAEFGLISRKKKVGTKMFEPKHMKRNRLQRFFGDWFGAERLEKLSRHEPLLDEEPEDDVIAELVELYGTEDAADCMPLD